MAYPISNAHTPYDNVNGTLVNIDNSHTTGIPFSSTVVPNGPHTMSPPGNNVQSAAAIYPCAQNGGKINKKKINKISRKYKMKGSKRSISRRIKRMKSRMRSRFAKRNNSKTRHAKRSRSMKGGAHAAVAPNYPPGHNQFDNNKMISNTYSTGGPLPAPLSALANPPIYTKLSPEVDNLNHAAPNAYGNYGAGSGFPSRGWF
jgi:hypothetical protein